MSVRVDEVVRPLVGGVPSDAFVEAIRVRNAVLEHEFGSEDATDDPAELTASWADEHEPKRLFVARDEPSGRMIGCAVHETRYGEASEAGWIEAWVLPSERGRGAGGRLWEALLDACSAAGNRRALVYAPAGRALVYARAGRGDAVGRGGGAVRAGALLAANGVGAIRPDGAGTRFLRGRGATLEQVIRMSRFTLPPSDDLGRRRRVAAGFATDYRIRTWTGPTPESYREPLARLRTAMSTEAPTAGLEEPEDVWTADRVAERDRLDEESPVTVLTAIAVQAATGAPAGHTQLSIPEREDRPVFQGDTLVLREHRGHRLGMLLKIAGLEALAALRTAHPSVVTWNAEENRPMLDVNEAVGFVPIGYEGAWRLDLDGTPVR